MKRWSQNLSIEAPSPQTPRSWHGGRTPSPVSQRRGRSPLPGQLEGWQQWHVLGPKFELGPEGTIATRLTVSIPRTTSILTSIHRPGSFSQPLQSPSPRAAWDASLRPQTEAWEEIQVPAYRVAKQSSRPLRLLPVRDDGMARGAKRLARTFGKAAIHTARHRAKEAKREMEATKAEALLVSKSKEEEMKREAEMREYHEKQRKIEAAAHGRRERELRTQKLRGMQAKLEKDTGHEDEEEKKRHALQTEWEDSLAARLENSKHAFENSKKFKAETTARVRQAKEEEIFERVYHQHPSAITAATHEEGILAIDILRLFLKCQQCGLRAAIARRFPLGQDTSSSGAVRGGAPPKDLTMPEVVLLLVEHSSQESAEREEQDTGLGRYIHLRKLMEPVQSWSESGGDYDTAEKALEAFGLGPSDMLNLTQFRNFLKDIFIQVRVDEDFVLQMLIWGCSGKFELPKTLARKLAKRALGRKPLHEEPLEIHFHALVSLVKPVILQLDVTDEERLFRLEQLEDYIRELLDSLPDLLAAWKLKSQEKVHGRAVRGVLQLSVLLAALHQGFFADLFESPWEMCLKALDGFKDGVGGSHEYDDDALEVDEQEGYFDDSSSATASSACSPSTSIPASPRSARKEHSRSRLETADSEADYSHPDS
eukprot:TRINITY_DN12694_c0_g1_i2.p1 TRINITY_DN12694_c0_g1~~TRINITY_DN12694_c0_g1_i2.p1  ORF type:complete len:694 (-),score=143.35 TRINITY_DN12694_c0_g1_i2:55-2013(-)